VVRVHREFLDKQHQPSRVVTKNIWNEQDWDLRLTASDGTVIDMGSATAYGACFGNYTDCANVYHAATNTGAAGVKLGLAHYYDQNGDSYEIVFAWSLDNWSSATYNSCSCNDVNPNGVTEVPPVRNFIFSQIVKYICKS
jgi:hypothetical protein